MDKLNEKIKTIGLYIIDTEYPESHLKKNKPQLI